MAQWMLVKDAVRQQLICVIGSLVTLKFDLKYQHVAAGFNSSLSSANAKLRMQQVYSNETELAWRTLEACSCDSGISWKIGVYRATEVCHSPTWRLQKWLRPIRKGTHNVDSSSYRGFEIRYHRLSLRVDWLRLNIQIALPPKDLPEKIS